MLHLWKGVGCTFQEEAWCEATKRLVSFGFEKAQRGFQLSAPVSMCVAIDGESEMH